MKISQVSLNFYTNILTLVANILVALYYTPFLVEKLGVTAYGVLPIALIVNQYVSMATGMLTHAYTRFYTVAVQRKNYDEASKVLTTSFYSVLLILLIITPLVVIFVENINHLIDIPEGYYEDAKLLFYLTIASLYFSIISSFLNVTLYAINRIDVMNYLRIIRQLFKLLFVIVLFENIGVSLTNVGVSSAITEFIILVFACYFFFKYKPDEIRLSKKGDKIILGAILSMASWVLLQELGDTLLYRSDNIILNHFYGSEYSGRLGAISELGVYIKSIILVVTTVFGPILLILYSKEEHERLKSLSINECVIVGCISAIMCGIVSGYGNKILSLWLDDSFATYSNWLMIKLAPLPFFAAGGILSFVYKAWNKMKKPAIFTLMLGIINFIIITVLPLIFQSDMSLYILIVCCIFSILQSYILGAYCVSLLYNDIRRKFVRVAIKIISVYSLSFIVAYSMNNMIEIHSVYQLLIYMIMIGLICSVFVYFIIFTHSERDDLLILLNKSNKNI